MTGLDKFFARRAAPPLKFRCGCCGDLLDGSDHMGDLFDDDHTEAVRVAYGPNVCISCANDYEPPRDEWEGDE